MENTYTYLKVRNPPAVEKILWCVKRLASGSITENQKLQKMPMQNVEE
jgi:hypothetical protein